MKGFTPMTTERFQKRYANGYLECLGKIGKSGGNTLIVFGVVMAAIGVLIGYGLIRFSIVTLSRGNSDDIPTLIFFGVLCLVFLIPSVPLCRLGRKRKGMDANDWLQTFAEASDYPESVIREFSSQVPQQDSIYFDVNGPTMSPGIITRDYIFFEGGQFCVIKRSDIIGAYFVNLIDIFNTKNKSGHCLHVAIFSNHNTCIVTRASQKRGKHLIEMLTEKHPEIDTAGGRILSDKEFDKMKQGIH